jgi:hypothetical protein
MALPCNGRLEELVRSTRAQALTRSARLVALKLRVRAKHWYFVPGRQHYHVVVGSKSCDKVPGRQHYHVVVGA